MKNAPPKLFHRFFRWFCHPKLLKYIEGDLMELYEERKVKSSKRKADVRFIVDVLLLFRPGIIRPAEGYQHVNTYGMYKSYLKIGWRNLLKNKAFSFISISGLSLGLSCSILIALWVQDEYGVDGFHKNLDRMYVVTSTEYSANEVTYGGYDTPGLLGEALKNVFPEVEYACNYGSTEWRMLSAEDKKMKQPGTYAGMDFFKLFSYPLLLGSAETALKSPESIALSRKMATILFGSPEEAIDKTVRFENYKDLKVTAVFEDLGDNVSGKFEYVINWNLYVERNPWLKDWDNSGPTTVVMMREHANAEALKPKLRHFIKGYNKDYSELDRDELSLQPFREMYLHSNFKDGKVAGGRIEYVQLFSLVAIFILLIACVNFMNLSTARSLKRAKEIGIRKVNGAVRPALISQFLLEAFLLTSMAVAVALVILFSLLPQFNLLTGKNIQTPVANEWFWTGIVVLTIITGLVSGSYPALLLSSFKPIAVMKQNFKTGASALFFRKGLVVFQFALSIIFILGMIVISTQVSFIQNTHLGYEKNNLIYLNLSGNVATHFTTFKQEALKVPGILEVTEMSQRPVEMDNTTGGVQWKGKDPGTMPSFVQVAVGYDFIKTMQSTLMLGRDFSDDFADSANYLINEKALRMIGYKDPIGMPLTFWGVKGTIIGVVKDFHFNSLRVPIEPLVLRLKKEHSGGYALFRTEPGKMSVALAGLEALHKKLNPDFIFAHQFADEEYFFSYKSEQVVERLSKYFAFLAIFISSLGLLGLAIFTAEQRTKEIGIRKVLGARVSQIITLLSGDFLKLIFVSIVIAFPIAYYAVNKWLLNFEYHIGIQWWMFFAAALSALCVALLTVSTQAIKAATQNPVNSLRSE